MLTALALLAFVLVLFATICLCAAAKKADKEAEKSIQETKKE